MRLLLAALAFITVTASAHADCGVLVTPDCVVALAEDTALHDIPRDELLRSDLPIDSYDVLNGQRATIISRVVSGLVAKGDADGAAAVLLALEPADPRGTILGTMIPDSLIARPDISAMTRRMQQMPDVSGGYWSLDLERIVDFAVATGNTDRARAITAEAARVLSARSPDGRLPEEDGLDAVNVAAAARACGAVEAGLAVLELLSSDPRWDYSAMETALVLGEQGDPRGRALYDRAVAIAPTGQTETETGEAVLDNARPLRLEFLWRFIDREQGIRAARALLGEGIAAPALPEDAPYLAQSAQRRAAQDLWSLAGALLVAGDTAGAEEIAAMLDPWEPDFAAELYGDLARARLQAGDLAGAERIIGKMDTTEARITGEARLAWKAARAGDVAHAHRALDDVAALAGLEADPVPVLSARILAGFAELKVYGQVSPGNTPENLLPPILGVTPEAAKDPLAILSAGEDQAQLLTALAALQIALGDVAGAHDQMVLLSRDRADDAAFLMAQAAGLAYAYGGSDRSQAGLRDALELIAAVPAPADRVFLLLSLRWAMDAAP